MKYLVHETTKEHVIWESGMPTSAPGYKCVEADAEGWIPWEGGECPLPASNQAEVKLQDGKQGNFDSIPLMTHRSWQKWNCGGDIIAYRPILAEKEEPQPKSILRHDFDFTSSGVMPCSAHSPSVFDRLKSAVAASESIPAIIAEIDALLPEGYCVTRYDVPSAGEPAKQLVEDMSDWRNWREGDLVEAIETYKDCYIQGDTYKIRRVFGGTIYTEFDAKGSPRNGWASRFFRFHSRPAKVAE